jgi:hypothetical protein
VFRTQAQIERTASVSLNAGTNTIVFTDLSEWMLPNSIQLRGKGTFTLLSLTNRTNFLEAKTNDKKISQLISLRDSLQLQISMLGAQTKVIESNISLLNSSNNITSNHKLTATELNALLDLNSKRMLEFQEQKLNLSSKVDQLKKQVQVINNQIGESGVVTRNSFKEVVAEIEVETATKMEFSLQYLVYNAGWNPSYGIRSENTATPLNIDFKAKVYQNTGYDWNNVQFTINSGDPSQSVQKPEINPNYVEFYNTRQKQAYSSKGNSVATFIRSDDENLIDGLILDQSRGEPLPGANVIIPELNKGVSTNADGFFEIDNVPNGNYTLVITYVGFKRLEKRFTISNSGLNVFALLAEDFFGLEELVVTGAETSTRLRDKVSDLTVMPEFNDAEIVSNQEISNQTSFSYVISRPYSVPSDGKEHTLEIKRETPKTEYIYASVPKLSKNAYLVGNLTEWDELNLIEGDANVYFENSFVGTSYLDPTSLLDTLEISLGKDERIVVERKKLKDFEERRFFGSKTRESLSFEITIRNTKQENIDIIVQDQIPISTDESIKVSEKEISGGILDKETGIITWRLKLSPNETKKLRLNFEIVYPKGKRISY